MPEQALNSPTQTVLPDGLCAAFQSAADWEAKLAALRRYFDLKAISEAADLQHGALCALRKGAEFYVLEIGPLKDDRRTVDLRLRFFRAARETGLACGASRTRPERGAAPVATESRRRSRLRTDCGRVESAPPTGPETASTAESDATNWAAQSIDLTSFTRLTSLAQSCGMVPNVDNIANVRDAEFRTGQYLAAFYNIERMYTAHEHHRAAASAATPPRRDGAVDPARPACRPGSGTRKWPATRRRRRASTAR